MPLSEHEQRILDEIERRLASEDPKFARNVSAVTPHGQALRRLKRAVAGFVAGLFLLIAAFTVPGAFIWLGLVAFSVMVSSSVVIATTVKHVGAERTRGARRQPKQSWFVRMEERWRKRFENGDGS